MGQILGLLRIIAPVFRPSMRQQEIDSINMNTISDLKLTDSQVEDLAQVIVSKHMATIAIKYLGLPHETVENLKLIRQGDYIAFNRDVLVLWRNKNQGIDQVQVSRN